MDRASQPDLPLERNCFSGLTGKVRAIAFLLFLVQILFVCFKRIFPHLPAASPVWPEAMLLIFAAVSLLASLRRTLPSQNVTMIPILIAIVSGMAMEAAIVTGISFESLASTSENGPRILHVPLMVPLMCIVALLSARGTGQFMLQPWRRATNYGYRLLGLTTALAVWLIIGWETFANASPTKPHGVPWTDFLAWALTSVAILLLLTPWLIVKKPGNPPSPDRLPAIIWLLINVLFMTTCISHQRWLGAAMTLAGGVVVAIFLVSGSRFNGPSLPATSTNQ